MTKQQQLEKLKSKLLAANICTELKSQATQLVFGSGNADADLLFIGEAPGKKEDESGEPFVGAAGKFLNEMLDTVGLCRSDIYITNIVKYRPPNNRDPLPEEKEAFWPFLLRQLAIISPNVVITLGRHSGQAFDPSLRISADHGQLKHLKLVYPLAENNDGEIGGNEQLNYGDGPESKQDVSSILLLPLYHPAAALYNGSLRQTLLQDFLLVRQFISNPRNQTI